MNIKTIKGLLKKERLDAWLIYQCQGTFTVGLNLVANEICEITELVTRPWYCLIKNNGQISRIYQTMEAHLFKNLRGIKHVYTERASLLEMLNRVIPKGKRVAMEISEEANIPIMSRIDYETVRLIKKISKSQIVSSANIVGAYTSDWGASGLKSHLLAVKKLTAILKTVVKEIKRGMGSVTDYELQQLIENLYIKHSLITIYHPIVAVGKDTGNPHYFPSKNNQKIINKNNLVLIDIWGKTRQDNAIYADITTMIYTGKNVPPSIQIAWQELVNARNKTITYLRNNMGNCRGSTVDKIARDAISKNGFGRYFTHRLGHNLSTELHGWGPNLDNYETIDHRKLILNSGYSIEPGIYTSKFGLRTEINVYLNTNGVLTVTTPCPDEILKI